MLLTKSWQDALDDGLDTVVVALGIAGAFDRVWHESLLENFRAKGIQDYLLQLLGDYLQGRTLQVVVKRADILIPASGGISATGLSAGASPVEYLSGRPSPATASSLSLR